MARAGGGEVCAGCALSFNYDYERYGKLLMAQRRDGGEVSEELLSMIEAYSREGEERDERSDTRPLFGEVAVLVAEVKRLQRALDERGYSE